MVTKKIIVGQTIWYYHIDRRTNIKDLKESVVTKVGNKYFEIEGTNYKFNIDSLRQQSEYSPNIEIVINKEEFDIEIKTELLISKLRKAFGHDGEIDIPLDKLIKIVEILES